MTTRVTVEPPEGVTVLVSMEDKTEGGEWRVLSAEKVAAGASSDFWVWDTRRIIVEEV